ncbi:MAG: transporter substrate-binding domain-containing protein [Raoultibacter sp.]
MVKQRLRRVFACLISLVLCVGLSSAFPLTPVYAANEPSAAAQRDATSTQATMQTDNELRVIRVGYPLQKGLTELSEEGEYAGYTYEYLNQIAQYTGWKYEFVTFEGSLNEQLTSALKALETGEIDILGSMSYSPELAQTYDYPTRNYGLGSTALFVPDKNPSVSASNIYSTPNLRIAVRSKAKQRRADLQTYAALIGVSGYEEVECASEDEMLQAVLDGRADAVLGVDLSPLYGFHVIARFASKPFYLAASKGSVDITADIDEALVRIEESEPNYSSELFSRYFNNSTTALNLNEMERSYIEHAPVLKVGLMPDRAPLQYFDEKTGQPAGVSKEMLDRISKQTGLRFEYVVLDSTRDMKEQIAERDLDIVAGLDATFGKTDELGVSLTAPYVTSQTMAAFREDVSLNDLRAKRAAVPIDRLAHAQAEGLNAVGYSTIDECLAAVDRRDADFTFASSYVIPYYLSASGYSGIRTTLAPAQGSQLCFGVVRPVEADLISILNKMVQGVSPVDLNAMIYANSFPEQKLGLKVLVERYPVPFAVSALVFALVIVVISGIFARSRARMASRDSLTGVYHAAAFRKQVDPLLTSSKGEHGAFVVADIDDFKKVNDLCGHFTGDSVLQSVAEVLKQATRPGDVVGRLGGDEFLMFWTEGKRETIDARCEALIAAIAQELEGKPGCTTLSIGIACVRRGEKYDDLYRRADGSLYDAKHVGKHTFVVSE